MRNFLSFYSFRLAELSDFLRRLYASRQRTGRPGTLLTVERCEDRTLLSVSQWASSVLSYSSQQ